MATVTKVTRKVRGKVYEYHAVRFTDPGTGKEKLRYFRSRKDAERARTEIDGRITTGTFNDEAHKATVAIIVERFRAANYFPRGEDPLRSTTVADYKTALDKYILPRWGSTRLVDIRASMVETWRNELLAGGAGRSPVRKALIVLGRLFRFAKRDHIVAHNPTVDVGKPSIRSRKGEEERLTPDQLRQLFRVIRGRTRVAVQLGARTGMREGEIFGLRWHHVDMKGRVIHVRGQYTHGEFVEFPKTDAGVRDLPIDKELCQVLITWKLSLPPDRKQPDSLVVATPDGTPLNVSNFLSREFYPALKAAKLPRVVFHSLRHTYKTILVSTDTPPAVVHSMLGHANFATTLKLYGGVTAQALGLASGKTSKMLAPRPDKNRTNCSK